MGATVAGMGLGLIMASALMSWTIPFIIGILLFTGAVVFSSE